MKTKTILALVAGLIAFAGSADAAYTFNFAIQGDPSVNLPYTGHHSGGTLNGVLTLNDAGTAATSVKITSIDFDSEFTPDVPFSFDYVTGTGANAAINSFTVTDGAISSANFLNNGDTTPYLYLNCFGTYNGLANLPTPGTLVFPTGFLLNTNGSSGITFSAGAAIPEPSALALLGLGAIGLVARRRRVG